MSLFSKTKRCDICAVKTPKSEIYTFINTHDFATHPKEQLFLCQGCFLHKAESYIVSYPHKALVLKPFTKTQKRSGPVEYYHFYVVSILKEYNFEADYIEKVKQLLATNSKCSRCDKSGQYFSVEVGDYYGIDKLANNPGAVSGEWLCPQCYNKEFSNIVTANNLVFKEYNPPIRENGVLTNWAG